MNKYLMITSNNINLQNINLSPSSRLLKILIVKVLIISGLILVSRYAANNGTYIISETVMVLF